MKAAVQTARLEPRGDPESQLQRFIEKFEPEHQKLIRACRKALKRRFPSANELVYDNYNFFVIGYSPTERPSDTLVSLAAGSNGVGLVFPYCGARLPDPHKLLVGSGSKDRFIRLESAKVLGRPEVEALIAAAVALAKAPLPLDRRGKLIIRSVSRSRDRAEENERSRFRSCHQRRDPGTVADLARPRLRPAKNAHRLLTGH
jgi:hypothetical protein